MADMQENLLDLQPVSKWGEIASYPTVGALRQLIFANTNGFRDKVIRLINKRQYVKISAFKEWIEECNGKALA